MLLSAPAHRTLNIAHRGARSLAPENTLAAGRKAVESGADMWELDLQMTADGELVVIHDKTLERTSNVTTLFPGRSPWRASDFTLEELRRLDFGSWFQESDPFGQIAAGMLSQRDLEEYGGERLPTLTEVLELTAQSHLGVNLEIKDLRGTKGHHEVVGKVAVAIKDRGMEQRVIVSSFNHDYLKELKSLDRRIATGVLVYSGRRDPVRLLASLEADAYHPKLTAIRLEDIPGIRKSGYEVFVWVANDHATMHTLIEAQASGIFTDFPQILTTLIAPSQ